MSSSPSSSSAALAPVSIPKPIVSPLIPKDHISELLISSKPTLMYYFVGDDKKIKSVIKFTDSSGRFFIYSDESLFAFGWRLFFSPDGNHCILTNGQESHLITFQRDTKREVR
jgi:hypothetical protein